MAASLELTISMPGLCEGTTSSTHLVRDLDINQLPLVGGHQEEEDHHDQFSVEDDDETNGGPPRKKLRLTKQQSHLLEDSFRQNHTLNPKQKEALALKLKLKPRQVEVWFQNRRARSKLKQTEIECEYLKKWFGSLTEQNKRLQKEVEELRALRAGPPHNHHRGGPMVASALSMCPRCERITTTSSSVPAVDNGSHFAAGKVPTFPTRHPSAAC